MQRLMDAPQDHVFLAEFKELLKAGLSRASKS